jgi:hypothetical protein
VKETHEGLSNTNTSQALSAHLGINAVRKLIMKRFYWKTIVKDVTVHIHECSNCQKCSQRNLKVKPELQTVSIPNEVMNQVGIDLIRLPQAEGFTHVVVLIDYFSKWTEAEALRDKSACAVANFIYKVICRHGCFRIQISDQGREFVNSVSAALYKMTGTEQRITSAYHPQANGLVERQNQTIKNSMIKILKDKVNEWPSVLDGVLFALRVKVHESTGYSPFFLMYKKEPLLPIDFKYETNLFLNTMTSAIAPNEEIIENMVSLKRKIVSQAGKNILAAQKNKKFSMTRDTSAFHPTILVTKCF